MAGSGGSEDRHGTERRHKQRWRSDWFSNWFTDALTHRKKTCTRLDYDVYYSRRKGTCAVEAYMLII